MVRVRSQFLLTSTILLSTLSSSVWAQDSEFTQSERPITLPSNTTTKKVAEPEALWKIATRADASTTYKDNVYKAKSNKEGDLIARIQPEVALVSNLDAHALKVTGKIDTAHYVSDSDNNFVDGGLAAVGRYDVNETISIDPTLAWREDHVDIGSFEDDPDTRSKNPTDYSYGEAGATLNIHPESYLFQLGGMVNDYNYDNVERINGTTNIQDDRDRNETTEFLRVGYDIRENLTIYTHGGIDQTVYDSQIDSTLLNGRDSDGKTLRLGAFLGNKNDFKWLDINAGYLNRDYDDNLYSDVDTIGFDAEGHYQIAADWEFTLLARRSIEENTLTATSSYIQTRVRTEAAYHISPSLEIAGNVRYTLNDFQVNESLGLLQREDKVYETGVNSRYQINETYDLDLGYNYAKRTSNNQNVEYTGNTIMLTLSASLN